MQKNEFQIIESLEGRLIWHRGPAQDPLLVQMIYISKVKAHIQ